MFLLKQLLEKAYSFMGVVVVVSGLFVLLVWGLVKNCYQRVALFTSLMTFGMDQQAAVYM